MVFGVRLLEVQLSELLDLKNLTKRDQQIVLLQLAIAQHDFTGAGQRIRIGCLSVGLQCALQLSLKNARRTAGLGDQLFGLNAAKFHFDMKWRFIGFGLNQKLARNVSIADVRRNLRKIEAIGVVANGRLQLLEKNPVPKRDFGDSGVAMQSRGASDACPESNPFELRHRLIDPIQKTEISVDQTDLVNFRCKR